MLLKFVHNTWKVKLGLAVLTAAVPALTIIVTAVEPINGKINPSIELNSLWIDNVTELSINPATRVTAPPEPKFVVGTSAALVLKVIAAMFDEISEPLSETVEFVRTNFAMIIYLLPCRLSRLIYPLPEQCDPIAVESLDDRYPRHQ